MCHVNLDPCLAPRPLLRIVTLGVRCEHPPHQLSSHPQYVRLVLPIDILLL